MLFWRICQTRLLRHLLILILNVHLNTSTDFRVNLLCRLSRGSSSVCSSFHIWDVLIGLAILSSYLSYLVQQMSDISQLLIHLLSWKISDHDIRWKTIYHAASHLCRDSGSVCAADILCSSSSLIQNLVNLCLEIFIICRAWNGLIDNNIRRLDLNCMLISICICKRLWILWILFIILLGIGVLLWLIFPIIFVVLGFFWFTT